MLRIKTDGKNQLILSIILKHNNIIIWNLNSILNLFILIWHNIYLYFNKRVIASNVYSIQKKAHRLAAKI